jgi:hypothetical protein
MSFNFLNNESEAFEKKGWKIGVYAVFAMKLAFSVVSVAYIVSNVQDEIKKIGNFSKEEKNEK